MAIAFLDHLLGAGIRNHSLGLSLTAAGDRIIGQVASSQMNVLNESSTTVADGYLADGYLVVGLARRSGPRSCFL